MASRPKSGGGTWCAAPNCHNSRKKGWRLFSFPREEERCRRWVQNCRRKDLIGKPASYLCANCCLCLAHFEPSQLINPSNPKSRLNWNAVPTLFDVPNPPKTFATKRKITERKEVSAARKKTRKNKKTTPLTYGDEAGERSELWSLNTDIPTADSLVGNPFSTPDVRESPIAQLPSTMSPTKRALKFKISNTDTDHLCIDRDHLNIDHDHLYIDHDHLNIDRDHLSIDHLGDRECGSMESQDPEIVSEVKVEFAETEEKPQVLMTEKQAPEGDKVDDDICPVLPAAASCPCDSCVVKEEIKMEVKEEEMGEESGPSGDSNTDTKPAVFVKMEVDSPEHDSTSAYSDTETQLNRTHLVPGPDCSTEHGSPANSSGSLQDTAMASPAPSTSRQQRACHTCNTLAEAVEMITTAGSDVEEDEAEDYGLEFIPESSDSDSSDSDWLPSYTSKPRSTTIAGLQAGYADSTPAADQDLSEEEFLQFLMKDWHQDFSFFPVLPPFTGAPGLHVGQECCTPIDFFRAIFDDTLLDLIVTQTNKYALECLHSKGELTAGSTFRKWKDITRADLIGFFTICIHMSVNKKPDLKDYWSKHTMLLSSLAPSVMSRERFLLILAMLHVSDNDTYIPPGQDGHDPLHKIRPVYEHLLHKFSTLYTPGENICVDEALCAWRGEFRFRVHRKDKPIKWGIKLYELCESATGYVYSLEIFANIPDLSNRPADIVMRLAESLLDEGRSVYVDNNFMCPELAQKLVERGTHCVGTVKPNRKGMPPQLREMADPPRGEVQAFRQGGVAILRWLDKRPVHVLTTKLDPREMRDVTTLHSQKRKPVAVQDYIINMAGVDRSDQLISYMPLRRKTIKWWKKLFFHFFTLSLIQGSILCNIYRRSQRQPKMSLKDYILACGVSLNDLYQASHNDRQQAVAAPTADLALSPSCSAQTPSPPAPQSRLCLMNTEHFLCPMPPRPSGNTNDRLCVVCTARARRQQGLKGRETKEWCRKCQTPLCVKFCQGRTITCFEVYHTIQNFADF